MDSLLVLKFTFFCSFNLNLEQLYKSNMIFIHGFVEKKKYAPYKEVNILQRKPSNDT